MILFELFGTEDNALYQELQVSNLDRQYDFMRSITQAAIEADRPFLSQTIIRALNYHAIVCLHTNAGEYRPCEVSVGDHRPPQHFRVKALMDDFTNEVNRMWEKSDPVGLGAYVLWRLNWIHPFINGNGRSARVAAYYVICVKVGALLPGIITLPELLRLNREEYVEALRAADASLETGGLDLSILYNLLSRLLDEQIQTSPQ